MYLIANIFVTNFRSRVEGVDLDTARGLMSMLSFQPKGYFFAESFKSGRWDGFIRFFNRPSNVFPTGLLPMVIEHLKCKGYKYIIHDMRKDVIRPSSIPEDYTTMSGKKLRDYQVDAVNKTITNIINNNSLDGIPFIRGIINIATNGGKTVIAEAIMGQVLESIGVNDKILFLTHSKEIGYQAQKSIQNDLGIDVGFIGDSTWNEEQVTVALIPTLHKNLPTSKCKNLLKDVKAFIADECHRSSSTSWYDVLNKLEDATIRIGLTGTIPEDDITKHRLYSVTGMPLVKISNKFLIDNGYSAKPLCYMIPVEEPDDIWDLPYKEAYMLGVKKNKTRNAMIQKVVQDERAKNNANILILVEHQDHGKILEELITPMNIGNVLFTHGKRTTKFRTEALEDLKSDKVDILIASSILDEGVDVDNINAIIYARGRKSDRQVLQGIGRGLRVKKDGSGIRVYDFLDLMNDTLADHSEDRYKILKEEGFEIKKLDVIV